jgi:hypothetical protein
MTSTYSDGAFHPSSDYSLSHFHEAKNGLTIEGIIEMGFRKVDDTCKVVLPDYRCVAYRAGGYDIGPEASRVLHKLNELGIRIDSSVIKGYELDYGYSKVDYRNAPASSSWTVALDGPMIKAATHGILELPVTSKPVSPVDVISRRFKKLTHGATLRSRAYRHGGKGFLAQQGGETLSAALRKVFNPIVLSFDREDRDAADLYSIVEYCVRKYKDEPGDLFITAIGHPKSIGPYHLDVMEQFIGRIRSSYGEYVSFITYRDVLN